MTRPGLAPILDFVLAERGWPQSLGLAAMAAGLPAVAAAGLEVALNKPAPADLQQRIRRGAERDRLAAAIRARAPLAPGSGWDRLRGYLASDLFDTTAEELWLEQDAGPTPDHAPLSVFLRFSDPRPAAARQAILRSAQAFDAPLTPAARAVLDRCVAACPEGTELPFLGLMLGRPGAPLRLILDGLPADGFGAYAAAVGLTAQADRIAARADRLFAYADRIRLALTIGARVEPEVGFECFVGAPERFDPRWHGTFAALVGDGDCTEAMRDKVLGWPGVLTPMSGDRPWPGALIAQALADDPHTLHWLDCRVSHVKTGLAGGAKAYFGFVDVTRKIDAEPEPEQAPAPAALPAAPLAADLTEATVDALLARRTQAGLWLDFAGFREGPSDEWVSAYIACALAETGRPHALAAARRVWARLSRRRRDGWGWNAYQPADADSTIWGLRLAEALGQGDGNRARRGLAFLARHIDPAGRVATYLPVAHAADFPDLPINPGWCAPHDCVTAAAAGLALLSGRCGDSLLAAQDADGGWAGYWWQGRDYPTALAVAALAASDDPRAAGARSRAAAWAAGRMGPGADAFALANALRIQTLAGRPAPAAAQERLAALRGPDGLWPGAAAMTIPNAAGDRIAAVDGAGLFTTATVLLALTALDRRARA